jgi:hypothetical protein
MIGDLSARAFVPDLALSCLNRIKKLVAESEPRVEEAALFEPALNSFAKPTRRLPY